MAPLLWPDLAEWAADDHAAAWAAFAQTADLYGLSAPMPPNARAAFEALFEPVEVAPAGAAHFTGYYEPELPASRSPSAQFSHALYAPPEGWQEGTLWHDRAEIGSKNLLAGREIAYVASAIEAFLAQVQGSVRLKLVEGGTLRLGYAGKNGHPYRSIGAELVRRGVSTAADMTPALIRLWCAKNPRAVPELLAHNPSFVFFRALELPDASGPLGAMNRPVTPGRSLAVDPAHVPLGSPVWINCPGFGARLMIAQDIGSAIKGPGRGDIFVGSGLQAGQTAGAINAMGRMVMLRRRG